MTAVTGLNRERGYLEIFQEVARLISMVLDPQQVMDLVVRRLPELLEVDAATIRLLDAGTNTFVLGAAHGLSDEYLSRGAIDSRDAMDMIMKGRPVAKTDIDADPFYQHSAEAAREGIKSVLSLPIIFQDHIIGIMRLLTRKTRSFTPMEISFSMTLAEQIGVAISNGRLFKEMENQVDFLKEVHEISRLVNSTLDLGTILQTIVDRLPRIMGMKACTIRLLQPETNQLELAAASGLSPEYLQRGSIRKEDSIFHALKGDPVAIYDAPRDPRVKYHDAIRREGIKSILAVPIKKGEEIIGVLRLLTTEHHCFTASEVTFATAIAEEGGSAILNALNFRKINLLFNQIEENERFLQTIMDSLQDRIIVVDGRKRVVLVNRRFLEQENLAEKALLGRPYDLIIPWRKKDAQECPVTKVLSTGKMLVRTDRVMVNDQPQWLERSILPIFDNAGRVEYAVETVRDITSQKSLEQERLEREKLAGVLETAGTVAHELNSPLFAAMGTAQLLREEMENEDQRREMDIILRNMKSMADLTKKMATMTGFTSREYVGDAKIIKFH
ncbi:MAG: GAF domain-containing protein [Desulfobulbaceae bacterium]|nr:GAF domain-containing protein [Desulfobulbaceae bacterium]